MNPQFFNALQRMVAATWPGTTAVEITIKLTNGRKARLPTPTAPAASAPKAVEFSSSHVRLKKPLGKLEAMRRTREFRIAANKRMVYFIQAAETMAIKIGSSSKPLQRLANLRSASAYKLTILGTIKGGRAKEFQLHRQFAAHRLNGEWFSSAIANEVALILAENSGEDQ